MNIVIEKSALINALDKVKSVVERHNTIEILSCFHVFAGHNKLVITATNMEIEVKSESTATIQESGYIAVPAITFYELIRKLPDGEIKIKKDGEKITVQSGRSRLKVACLDQSAFPKFPDFEANQAFMLDSGVVCNLIDKTLFAASKEEARYYLGGIYLHVEKGILNAVATNGHQLAWFKHNETLDFGEMEGIIIPSKSMEEIRKISNDFDGKIAFSFSKNMAQIVVGSTVIRTKLIDGRFPDYNRIFPNETPFELEVDRYSILCSIDRAGTLTDKKSSGISLKIENNNISITSNSKDASLIDDVDCELKSEGFNFRINYKYIETVLKKLSSDQVSLYKSNEMHIVIKDSENENVLYVIMAMRMN